MEQCNFLTDILDLVYLRFAKNVQRVHLSTDEPAASRMLEPFGEVGGDVLEYLSSRIHFAKKNLTAGVYKLMLKFDVYFRNIEVINYFKLENFYKFFW